MKKLLFSIALAGVVLSACNNSGSEETKTENAATENTAANSNMLQTDVINNPETASQAQQVDPATLAAITFEKYEHNFGKVKEGEKVSHVFKFTNTGANDLIISDARGSCGCTVPQWPKEPIKPGATGEIKVEYDSKGKSGVQKKTVSITANTNPNITTLNITTEVIPAEGASAN
jgi:hypothetical protein